MQSAQTPAAISAERAARIPLWAQLTIMQARTAYPITLAPRLSATRRAKKFFALQSSNCAAALADDNAIDGCYSIYSPVYATKRYYVAEACQHLTGHVVDPLEPSALWDDAEQACKPFTGPAVALILADTISRVAPTFWRDYRPHLLRQLSTDGLTLDPVEAALLAQHDAWLVSRDNAMAVAREAAAQRAPGMPTVDGVRRATGHGGVYVSRKNDPRAIALALNPVTVI